MEVWSFLNCTGLLQKRAGEPDIDVEEFADFLSDLPGGPDVVPDVSLLLDGSAGGFSEGAFFFRNIVVQDVITEVLRLRGSQSL